MGNEMRHFIGGGWITPDNREFIDVIDPSTGEPFTQTILGTVEDVDAAVAAAKTAFESYSFSKRKDRIALLEAMLREFDKRREDFAEALCREMGAPYDMALEKHTGAPVAHIRAMIEVLRTYEFEFPANEKTLISREPVGVCGLITPWNWPLNQIACKVIPAIAAGCTMVLKPSEASPLSAAVWAEVMHDAGVPAGVFNMVHGSGAVTGAAISSHPDIDMVSITGSTRAGIAVAQEAASTVKRVTQELGGKSANIILDDADIETAVARGVRVMMSNSGQSCSMPTRMLVPRSRMDEAAAIAAKTANSLVVGDVRDPETDLGPVANRAQYEKVCGLIRAGIDEGAQLVAGGPELPDGISRGFFVRPTIFSDVDNSMRIAQEEIFGPVLVLIGHDGDDDAVRIANESAYGLAAHIQTADLKRARRLAPRLRVGNVHINYPAKDLTAPFGGYKASGTGREYGRWGFEEFLEIKAIGNFDGSQGS
ncbi:MULTISPECIES: aldehyde dehydrogenase family protein [unclassified Sulfitobacter]|uniref:aldehyde dehydrogenase family protein n=1 Tax=unclassified Sulfitobacter TaxID=196795 RepID=UPI0007C2EAF3|nr:MULTISPECIES: aldehyde dehydrogenase family protein [unclassified Sulfitobacter]KZX98479.1 aldehyde dehydrogenase [Sulfitobacter sp. HI0023]KZZ66309.1 aldehyde dehydrogenase [Sulfitobacter sp. HI0129]